MTHVYSLLCHLNTTGCYPVNKTIILALYSGSTSIKSFVVLVLFCFVFCKGGGAKSKHVHKECKKKNCHFYAQLVKFMLIFNTFKIILRGNGEWGGGEGEGEIYLRGKAPPVVLPLALNNFLSESNVINTSVFLCCSLLLEKG